MTTTTTTKELPTSLLNKINAIIENECIIEQDTFANVENNTALKRRQDELSYTDGSFTYTKRKDDNKLSYTDGCFTYTKRIKPSL
jgi:predicted nucleic acid-binding protein